MDMEMELEMGNANQNVQHHSANKKKRGLFKTIKVALFMLKQKSKGTASKSSVWTRVVEVIRSFYDTQDLENQQQHLDHRYSSPPLPPPPPSFLTTSRGDPWGPSMSPDSPTMSQYASAQNLQELDRNNESGDNVVIEMIDDEDDAEMIDARAEEFIAHFYKEMRLQRFDSMLRNNQSAENRSA